MAYSLRHPPADIEAPAVPAVAPIVNMVAPEVAEIVIVPVDTLRIVTIWC